MNTLKVKERILVTVRTYPTPSTKYRETVCTGGINDKGEWRRIYPVFLRSLPADRQFKTWDVITLELELSKSDRRLESRRPNFLSIRNQGSITDWGMRCEWVNPTICPSLAALISEGKTLGPVAVNRVKELEVTKVSAEWSPRRRANLEVAMLFDDPLKLEKIPFEFRFVWDDADDVEHKSLVISWEMAQTWRNYRRMYKDPIEKMKEKLLGDLYGSGRTVSFFMGNHSRFRNTFMICGWFVPPSGEASSDLLF